MKIETHLAAKFLAVHASFTLIELLVVIAIISILAALLSPALKTTRDKARQVQCASNLHQVGLAFRMYAEEHNDFYPRAWNSSLGLRWHDFLLPYLSSTNAAGGKGVLVCPSARVTASGLPVSANKDYCVYKKNQWCMNADNDPNNATARYDSQVILAFDGLPDDQAASDNSEWDINGCRVDNRHLGSANYLFGDQHVAALQTTLLTNNWFLK